VARLQPFAAANDGAMNERMAAPWQRIGQSVVGGIKLENLSRPSFNCGLFYCQDPGGRYTVDPRLPAQ
jgi:hypothetical protein